MIRIPFRQRAVIALLGEARRRGFMAEFHQTKQEIHITDRRGAKTRAGLNATGTVAYEVTPRKRRYSYAYDDADRLRAFARPEGSTVDISYAGERPNLIQSGERSWKFEWDAQGNLAQIRYPDATTTQMHFAETGICESFDTRDGGRIHIERDARSRIVAIIDPRGNTTRYDYSRWNSADRITYANGSVEEFIRGDDGRLIEAKLNGKRWAGFEIGATGRMNRISTEREETSFEYDESGRVIRARNAASETLRKYDSAGRITEEDQGGSLVKFAYDERGLLSAITTDNGEQLRYFYDDDGRLETAEDWDGHRHVFSYGSGLTVTHRYPNGAVAQTVLDSDGRPLKIRTSSPALPNGGRTLEYSYDDNDRISSLLDSDAGNLQFRYGPEGDLLTASSGTRAIGHRYDAAGNCTSANGTDAEFGPMNELLRLGGTTFEHDDRGNSRFVWKDGRRLECAYDQQNRLIRVDRPGAAQVLFSYDAFGRRILKEVGKTTTRYVWAQDVLLAEITEQEEGRERRDYLFVPYSHCPLSVRVNSSKFQYHTDHQGTPQLMTDDRGLVAWSAHYEPFGAARETIRRVRQPIRFPGHYHDEETGLYYNRTRYYSPTLGRYLSRDPLGYLAGVNWYTYAGNDPVNNCDPLGLLSFWKTIAAAAAITAGVALMVVAGPVIIAGAMAVAAGAAVAAGTVGAIGAFVGGAALVGVGIGLATTNEDQSAGQQALHVIKYGLVGAAGGASAVMTLFGAAGMAGMAMGGGSGMVLCGAGGSSTILPTSAAPMMAAGGVLGMVATGQMAMSQVGEGGGGASGQKSVKDLSDDELADEIKRTPKDNNPKSRSNELRYERYRREGGTKSYDDWLGTSRGGRPGNIDHQIDVEANNGPNGLDPNTQVGSRVPDGVGRTGQRVNIRGQEIDPGPGNRVVVESERFGKNGQMVADGRNQVRDIRAADPNATIVVTDPDNPGAPPAVYAPGQQPPPVDAAHPIQSTSPTHVPYP